MYQILLAMYINCVNQTTFNTYTLFNLPGEQCMVIYDYAQQKCYSEIVEPLETLCVQESPECDREIMTNIVDLSDTCRPF